MSDRRTRYPGPIAQAGVIAHDLIAQGFAEDAALAALLDRYPAELFDINLYDYDDEGQVFNAHFHGPILGMIYRFRSAKASCSLVMNGSSTCLNSYIYSPHWLPPRCC